MKPRLPALPLLGAVLSLLIIGLPVLGQNYTVLHTFARGNAITNTDGFNPNGWLTWAGTNLYGSTQNGGTTGSGTIFAMDTNGGFRLIYTFPTDTGGAGNSFGANPNGGLVVSNSIIYGTALYGGSVDNGVIFSIGTNGSGITALYSFPAFLNTNKFGDGTNAYGSSPVAGLVMSGKKLFGTTQGGGSGGNGVVFSMDTGGSTPTILHHFTTGNTNADGITVTNSDGSSPSCQLLLVGTNLYGTTAYGGTNGFGTIFRVSTNGAAFTVLRHLGSDEGNPNSGPILSGATMYGMGGNIVYSLGTNGSTFSNLLQFAAQVDYGTYPPYSGLTVSNGTLYGAANAAGAYNYGQIFALTTNNASYINFHDFSALSFVGYPPKASTNLDGAYPGGGLVLLGGALYGAANSGGTNSVGYYASGVLFRVVPPGPVLSSAVAGSNLLCSFPALGAMSYTVQQNTNLSGTNWTTRTNFAGDGTIKQFSVPFTNPPNLFLRVRQP